jgi:hypothetical protein
VAGTLAESLADDGGMYPTCPTTMSSQESLASEVDEMAKLNVTQEEEEESMDATVDEPVDNAMKVEIDQVY